MLEVVEDGQEVVQNNSELSVSDDNSITDETIQLMIEEFNMLEVLVP